MGKRLSKDPIAPRLARGDRVRVLDLRTVPGGRFTASTGTVIYPPNDGPFAHPTLHVVELDGPFCHLKCESDRPPKGVRPRRNWVCSNDLRPIATGPGEW